jgi:hypothetical protein
MHENSFNAYILETNRVIYNNIGGRKLDRGVITERQKMQRADMKGCSFYVDILYRNKIRCFEYDKYGGGKEGK